MKNTISTWTKYAIIATFVKKLESRERVGRTALQKLIYLLQNLYKVDCGYEFRFYTYGPFSSEILSDIEEMETYNALKVHKVLYPSGYSGYEIESADESDKIINIAHEFITEHSNQIDSLISCFKDASAEQLELYATIVWVDRELSSKAQYSTQDIGNIVKELKPKFNEDIILTGISFIKEQNFLNSCL